MPLTPSCKKPRIKVRPLAIETKGDNFLPIGAKELVATYTSLWRDCGLKRPVVLEIDGLLPKSLNHQTMRNGNRTFLVPEIQEMRKLVKFSMDGTKRAWRPSAVMAAVVIFYSPLWLTKEYCVRELDIDNKIKPILDAFCLATNPDPGQQLNDSQAWSVAAFKATANKTKTLLYLFDLGEVVPVYQG